MWAPHQKPKDIELYRLVMETANEGGGYHQIAVKIWGEMPDDELVVERRINRIKFIVIDLEIRLIHLVEKMRGEGIPQEYKSLPPLGEMVKEFTKFSGTLHIAPPPKYHSDKQGRYLVFVPPVGKNRTPKDNSLMDVVVAQ